MRKSIVLTILATAVLIAIGVCIGYATDRLTTNLDEYCALAYGIGALALGCIGLQFCALLNLERLMVILSGVGIPFAFAAICAEYLGRSTVIAPATSLLGEFAILAGNIAAMCIYCVAGSAALVCIALFSLLWIQLEENESAAA